MSVVTPELLMKFWLSYNRDLINSAAAVFTCD